MQSCTAKELSVVFIDRLMHTCFNQRNNPVYYDKLDPGKTSITRPIHSLVAFSDCSSKTTLMEKEISALRERILQLEAASSVLRPSTPPLKLILRPL